MSISFATGESKSTLEEVREARLRANSAKPATSAARVEANRSNARKSTGPRSADGKRRSSRNALSTASAARSPACPASARRRS